MSILSAVQLFIRYQILTHHRSTVFKPPNKSLIHNSLTECNRPFKYELVKHQRWIDPLAQASHEIIKNYRMRCPWISQLSDNARRQLKSSPAGNIFNNLHQFVMAFQTFPSFGHSVTKICGHFQEYGLLKTAPAKTFHRRSQGRSVIKNDSIWAASRYSSAVF